MRNARPQQQEMRQPQKNETDKEEEQDIIAPNLKNVKLKVAEPTAIVKTIAKPRKKKRGKAKDASKKEGEKAEEEERANEKDDSEEEQEIIIEESIEPDDDIKLTKISFDEVKDKLGRASVNDKTLRTYCNA